MTVLPAHHVHVGESYEYQGNRLVVKTADREGDKFAVTGDLYDPGGRFIGPTSVHSDQNWNLPFTWVK